MHILGTMKKDEDHGRGWWEPMGMVGQYEDENMMRIG
jgi:hypothetical protein